MIEQLLAAPDLAPLDLAGPHDEGLREVLQSVTDAGVGLTGAEYGAFFYSGEDEHGERLDLHVLSGLTADAFPGHVPVRSTHLFAPTFTGQGAVLIADVLADPRYGGNASRGVPGAHVGVRSYLAVPVVTPDGRVLGALLFGHRLPGRFDERAEIAARTLAAHAATAAENARLLAVAERARAELTASVAALRALARDLQQGLLPSRLPELARVQVAVRYQAASGVEVGGDWYDVIALEDGSVTFVIGDVQGHSTTAAGLMGQLRTAVRAYVTEGHDLATALARTNALLVQMHTELFATCCLLQLDQATGDLVAATAGHPPPLVVNRGQVRELELPIGVPLGMLEDSDYRTARVPLSGPTRVLLYTDGVVESSSYRDDRGFDALLTAAADPHAVDCDALADAVLANIPHRLTDDAALLVLDYAGPLAPREETALTLLPELGSVAAARRFLRAALRDWAVPEDTVDTAQLIASELVTNAVTHTGTAAQLVLSREPDGRLLRICVGDGSTRHPAVRDAGPDALGGRGMAIVEGLAHSWGVTDQGEGKVVWAQLALG